MRQGLRWLQSLIICVLLTSMVLKAQEAEVVGQDQPTAGAPATVEPQPASTEPTQPAPVDQPAATPVQEAPPAPEQPQLAETKEEVPAEPKEAVQAEQPKEAPQPTLGPDEIRGIDTVDVKEGEAQGNWLYKRVWWERAEAKYEKIRSAVNKIFEMRTSFFAKRTELDKNVLDPFYIKIGLSQGELQELLAELISKVSKEAKPDKDTDVLEQAEDEKSTLEQLQKEVQQVVKQDSEVEEAILMLVEQLNRIRRFEQEAWQNFKNIARVLDDKKARELFYKIDNAWRNIQEMQGYIEKTYSSSFDRLVERIKEKISKIDAAIAALKEKGIDLKKRVQTEEEEEAEEEAPRGFFTRYIIDPVKNAFKALWSVIRWPYDKIMGKKAVEEESEEPEEGEEASEPQKEVAAPETKKEEKAPESEASVTEGMKEPDTSGDVSEQPQQDELAVEIEETEQ